MPHVPKHRLEQYQDAYGRHGDITATHWVGPISIPDLYWVLDRQREAHERARRKVLSLSLISKESEFPESAVRDKMGEMQPILHEHQTSAHLVITKPGQYWKTKLMTAAAFFMRGTGGMLFIHESLNEALDKAASLGHLNVPREEVVAWLRRVSFPAL